VKKELAISLMAMTAGSSAFASNWACMSDTSAYGACAPDPGYTGYCVQTAGSGGCMIVGPYTLTGPYSCGSLYLTQGRCMAIG
jgi:hypothetical protein